MLDQLSEKNLLDDPIDQFKVWFEDAKKYSGVEHPNSCCLSTVGTDGLPEGRVVLLKRFDGRGFVFYTNYNSRKARSLAKSPRACLSFHWDKLMRQIRIAGDVEKIPEKESEEYFAGRPRGSQLSAWASAQSEEVDTRAELEKRMAELDVKYAGVVPRPPYWGGYLLIPSEIEFWQSRDDRLHDRFLFRRGRSGWEPVRLCP